MRRNGPQIPFYDDANHVAYGWQQMSVLPDTYNFVGGMEDDPPLSPRSKSQTWPVEQHSDDEEDEPSGFNPNPGRRQGPRRPRPLTESKDSIVLNRGGSRRFKPLVNPTVAEREDVNSGADHNSDRSVSVALAPKDANQKLHGDHNQVSPFLKLTRSDREKSRQRSKKLGVDELESPRQADRGAERMAPLHEEPAPLLVRKKRGDIASARTHSRLDHAHILRAEQDRQVFKEENGGIALETPATVAPGLVQSTSPGPSHLYKTVTVIARKANGSENEEMESLIAVITEQISAFTVQEDQILEHLSAVPKPLNLAAIEAAKQRRRMAKMESVSSVSTQDDARSQEKMASVQPVATGVSSEFETLSVRDRSEHNGVRKKWYKGFRRSK
ncbi:hypothetical protein N0V86_005854 [Didymella sp. IMI 355093]|nr:hypothetical protein N0V86_005854 [Didymella sp. IMI 355093]